MVIKKSGNDTETIKMKEFKYTINGEQFTVQVGNTEGNVTEVTVNGEAYSVEREQPKETVKKKPVAVKVAEMPAAEGNDAGEKILSPLPGTITEIKVKIGDSVKEGDVVLILEAMKMQNNIETEKDGVVTAIYVQEGEAVKEDTPLICIG